MNRRYFLSVFGAAVVSASAAFAASYEDAVIAQLRAQGYSGISVEHTLLGRVKISALLKGGRREIILNPRTGEVLRDLWIAADGGPSVPSIARSTSGNGGGTDDDGNDDGGDDSGDDSDSNSGGSGGNSGGSGGGGDDNNDDGGDDDGGDDNDGGDDD